MRLSVGIALTLLAVVLFGTSAGCNLAKKSGPDSDNFGSGGGTTTGNAVVKNPLYFAKLRGLGPEARRGLPFMKEAHASGSVGVCIQSLNVLNGNVVLLSRTVGRWVEVSEIGETLLTALNVSVDSPFDMIVLTLYPLPECNSRSFHVALGQSPPLDGFVQASVIFEKLPTEDAPGYANDLRLEWGPIASALRGATSVTEVLDAFGSHHGHYTFASPQTASITFTATSFISVQLRDLTGCPASFEMELWDYSATATIPLSEFGTAQSFPGISVAIGVAEVPVGLYGTTQLILDKTASATCRATATEHSMAFVLNEASYDYQDRLAIRFTPTTAGVAIDPTTHQLDFYFQSIVDWIAGGIPGLPLQEIFATNTSIFYVVP